MYSFQDFLFYFEKVSTEYEKWSSQIVWHVIMLIYVLINNEISDCMLIIVIIFKNELYNELCIIFTIRSKVSAVIIFYICFSFYF